MTFTEECTTTETRVFQDDRWLQSSLQNQIMLATADVS
jgi:hypothetical protein